MSVEIPDRCKPRGLPLLKASKSFLAAGEVQAATKEVLERVGSTSTVAKTRPSLSKLSGGMLARLSEITLQPSNIGSDSSKAGFPVPSRLPEVSHLVTGVTTG